MLAMRGTGCSAEEVVRKQERCCDCYYCGAMMMRSLLEMDASSSTTSMRSQVRESCLQKHPGSRCERSEGLNSTMSKWCGWHGRCLQETEEMPHLPVGTGCLRSKVVARDFLAGCVHSKLQILPFYVKKKGMKTIVPPVLTLYCTQDYDKTRVRVLSLEQRH